MTVAGRGRSSDLSRVLESFADEIVELRHDIHAHPELSRQEFRTTKVVADRLYQAGLRPMLLPGGTGLVCDIGDIEGRSGGRGPNVALRADLDALPLTETSDVPFRSQVDGVCHACGHDVHSAALVGAGLALNLLHQQGRLPGSVRLIFQPAEEVHPGGALTVLDAGALDGIDRAYGLHCDPTLDVGMIGSRSGPITSAVDMITVRLHGTGGHTSRPHRTEDLVFALSQVAVQTSAVLSRRLDPRAGVAMVWGSIHAGKAPNAVPALGELRGTLRCLDATAWAEAGSLVIDTVQEIVRPYGVRAEIEHQRGVPPTVNDVDAVAVAEDAIREHLGERALVLAEQSLGGEDFAWMLEKVPGAMMRLGTRVPGGVTVDLHQGDFVADDSAVLVGAMALVSIAMRDLSVRNPDAGATSGSTSLPEPLTQSMSGFVAGSLPEISPPPDPASWQTRNGDRRQAPQPIDVDDPPHIDTWSEPISWSSRHL
jgi:amidohydrolase